ncbi:MAG: allantoinase [Thermomicrobiales bacterium]
MAPYDLILRAGSLVSGDGVAVSDIAIADGRIVAVEAEIAGQAREEFDATGLHLFPGVVDPHVHFNEPGRTEWEGWATGSRALAAGGGTTCCEMPLNALPPTIDGPAFDAKCDAAATQSVVDFALWGGLVPGNLDRLDELAARGVVGFKAFMSQSGTPDFEAADDLTLYEGMTRAARLGVIVAVHAENDTITSRLAQRAVAAGKTGVRDYLASRPIIAEVEAIGRAITFAEETGCALHVVHVSTGRGVAAVTAARARGVDVTCETCPHYLVFTEEDVEAIGALAKCAPPIRSAAERDALWQLLETGEIALIASDHSPAPPEMKQHDDVFQIWGGISGIQSTLPIMLSDGHHGRGLSLSRVAAVTATNAARRFRLPNKGRIAPGFDADLALVDLGADQTPRPDDLHDRHRQSPYAGRTFRGRVVRTLLRGETIYLNGAIVAKPVGRLVRPEHRT